MKINKRIIGFKTFSTKVIVMTIGIFCVVLVLMIALLTYRETRFMEENFFRRGQDMLTGVREASRIALLAEDIDRLESVANENMKHRQEILYIVFYRYDGQKIYTSVKNDSFKEELENISREFQQQLSQNVIEWHDEVIIRNLSIMSDNTLASEFWTRISSSEIGEIEMLTGIPMEADKSDSDEVSGYICLGVSKAELTDITGRVTRDSLIAGILTLLTISIVTAWLLKRLMSPFSELVKGVQAVAEGDMERTISVRSMDEVSRLANEFNKMVLALKERQSMLVESEYKFRSLFERIHSGILIFDRCGDILDSNPSMIEMIGYRDIPSLTNVPMEKIFKNHKDYEMLVRRIQEECNIQDLQLVLTNQKTGKDVETNVSITCQTDANGDYEYSEAFIVDITHITELEKRLLHAQKMEAVGTLAGGIAHDFNNILTVVAGRIQLLAMSPAVQHDEILNEHLLEMEHSVERAGNLVSQILGFARKGMYKADVLYLNKVVQEVRSFLGETIDRRIEISLELTHNLLPIKGDEGQLFQSLLNICLNSCDAMPDGGKLTVKTGVLVSKEEVAVIDQVMPPGKYVFLEVDDTGSGMDKETISKIFDPFFTTKDVGKGTGLGMAMVHGIVSNHGGYLNVESLGGRGTTFTIYFSPILEEGKDQDLEGVEMEIQESVSQRGDTAYSVYIKDDPVGDQNILAREPGKVVPETKSDQNDLSSLVVKGKANTILLVDDEENILKMNQAFFSTVEEYDLFTASSGEEAIEILKKYRESLDIVVLDISMPGMGGRKAFQVIHELFPDLPVIVATGHARDETVNSMLEGGAVDLILKPYMGFDLLKAVNACCSRRGVET